MEKQNSLAPQTSNELLEVVTSLQTFLSFLPEPLQKAWESGESIINVEEAVNLPHEQKIAKLQQVNEVLTYKSIGRLLARMTYELHIADGLSTVNIKNIAKRLTTDSEIRWWLTLADIDLLCRQIVEGKYGKFFGHFGEGEFYNCMKQYCDERNKIHWEQNAKDVTDTKQTQKNIGYSIKDGRIHVENKGDDIKKKKRLRFTYDKNGNITGEDPLFWSRVREEKSDEEMDKINKQNKFMERVRTIMKEDPDVGYMEAVRIATEEMEKNTKDETKESK